MEVNTFQGRIFLVLTLAAAVFASPASYRKEDSQVNPSLTSDATHIMSALSISENSDNQDDLSNIPRPISKNSVTPEVLSLNIWSNIKYRYATTLVTSRVVNWSTKPAEAVFQFFLPENAFISNFLMEVKGKVYKAYVKEKEEAKKEYEEAIKRGQAAAHIEVTARDSNLFSVSVNLEPSSKMTFNLTYEELLTRHQGLYSHVIHLVTCNQVIKEMKVEVYINEPQNITKIKVPEPTISNDIGDAVTAGFVKVLRSSWNSALVVYEPSVEKQRELLKIAKKKESSSQRLRIQYDVYISAPGEILLNDGYFVHFFAPSKNILGPSRIPRKHVIFVLDTSASMFDEKLSQLKEAMKTILDSLHYKDYFSIIQFNSNIMEWSPHKGEGQNVHRATVHNKADAKSYILKMEADGGTNIAEAILSAVKTAEIGMRNHYSQGVTAHGKLVMKLQPMIIFLTDGEPTVGDTNFTSIIHRTKELNKKLKVPIFSLAFGENTDYKFLKKLSLQNDGFARKIYSSADAALQLQSFFQDISSPLLNNVTFSYVSPLVDQSSLTKSMFHTYFDGTEVIIAGRLNDATSLPKDLRGHVSSSYYEAQVPVHIPRDYQKLQHMVPDNIGNSRAKPNAEEVENIETLTTKYWPSTTFGKDYHDHKLGSLERLWAYLTIQQLLDEEFAYGEEIPSYMIGTEDKQEKESTSPARKKALMLALKYGFVTPLTSLVVVKPKSDDNGTSYFGNEYENGMMNNFISTGLSSSGTHFRTSMGLSTVLFTVYSNYLYEWMLVIHYLNRRIRE